MVCIWAPFSGRMDGLGDTGIDLHWHGCGSILSYSFVADSNWKKLFHCKPAPPHLCVTADFGLYCLVSLNAGSRQHREPSRHFAQRCTIRDAKYGPH